MKLVMADMGKMVSCGAIIDLSPICITSRVDIEPQSVYISALNSLPSFVKHAPSISIFCRKLKTVLFTRPFNKLCVSFTFVLVYVSEQYKVLQ